MYRIGSLATAACLLTSAAFLQGCEWPGGEPDGTLVYDSAGVEIVVNRAVPGTQERSWSVSESPIWSVGARDDPAHELFNVVGVVRLENGRVAVGNGGTNEVRVFDQDEEFLFGSGGPGVGPGEFTGLAGLHRMQGDSVVAMDLNNRRISVLDSGGRFARSFNIPQVDAGSILELVGVLSEQWFLYRTLPVMGATTIERGTDRLPVNFYRTDLEGGDLQHLGEFPGFEIAVTPMTGRPPLSGLLTFGRRAVAVPTSEGFFLGSRDAYEIGLYGPDGTLMRLVRNEVEPRPVLSSHVEQAREEMSELFAQSLEFVPSAFPPFEAFRVDSEGVVWVGRYLAPGDEQREWDVFDAKGFLVATLPLPASMSVHQVGSDFVLGVRTDALGVEHVEVYGLERGGTDPAGERLE